MPELMAQVDRIERQVALISTNLGIPYDYPGNAETPPEVIELAQRGDQKGAVAKYRELTGVRTAGSAARRSRRSSGNCRERGRRSPTAARRDRAGPGRLTCTGGAGG